MDEKHIPNPALARISLLSGEKYALSALNGADYHLGEIRNIIGMAESKWTPEDFDLPNKLLDSKNTNQLIWHTRSVFWELVGVSDMLLQWANTRFGLGLQESQVRWSDMKKRPAKVDNDLWLNVQNIINNEMESAWSFEVKTYRNFSHVSLLIPSSVISKAKGPIGIYLEPARVGALPQDIRLQLDSYIQAMRDFGGKVFSAKLN